MPILALATSQHLETINLMMMLDVKPQQPEEDLQELLLRAR